MVRIESGDVTYAGSFSAQLVLKLLILRHLAGSVLSDEVNQLAYLPILSTRLCIILGTTENTLGFLEFADLLFFSS